MLEDNIYLEVAGELLELLRGKINYSMSQQERLELASRYLLQVLRRLRDVKKDSIYSHLYSNQELRRRFLERFFSLEEIEELINNPNVEDIAINGTRPIFVHTTDEGLKMTDHRFSTFGYLNFFIKKLVVFSGRRSLEKIDDFELPFGRGRVNVVESPFGPQITIAKLKEKPLSIIELIERNSLNYQVGGFLWLAVEGMQLRPANILIVGGPGAGKTTLLNALLSFIPRNERVVIIEDTLELNTQGMYNFCRLETQNGISLERLVKNTLRMRPERIIVGEVRGREAQDMMTAMNIGKYCIATIHAPDTKEAMVRLENVPMNIPPALINLIDIFIVVKKYTQPGRIIRVVEEISETSFMEQKRPLLSILFKYNFSNKKIEEIISSAIFREKIAQAASVSPLEVIEELNFRIKLLYLLHKKRITDFKELDRFFALYSKDKLEALALLNLKEKEVTGLNLKGVFSK